MTKRNPNTKIELQGVRYVQAVVQDNDSIFEPFSRENDQGNDCLIEFVKNNIATNYGVYVQIKSGRSYKDSQGYKIPADKAHLSYWNNGINLTIGIVYDPELNKAFWVDITSYLNSNPQVLEQEHHAIRVDARNEFAQQTFPMFMDYCFKYGEGFMSYENYGRSLEWFADFNRPGICYEGLKSLYSTHRSKTATWYYVLSSFSKIKEEGIRRNIVGLVSNYFIGDDVLWHSGNINCLPSSQMQHTVSNLLTECFGLKEVKLLISFMREGIVRGSFSYRVYTVLCAIENVHRLLKDICFEHSGDAESRNFCLWLYMQLAKFYSIEETIQTANHYLSLYPDGHQDEALLGVKESIEAGELWPVG
jgi:hypothetical protein